MCTAAGTVEGASVPQWSRQTPAPGWSVRGQIAHLTSSDDTSPDDAAVVRTTR
jgi:hypothetical protein